MCRYWSQLGIRFLTSVQAVIECRWSFWLTVPITAFLATWPMVAVSGIGSCDRCQPTYYFFDHGDKSEDAKCPQCCCVSAPKPNPLHHKLWNGAALSLFHKLSATPKNHVFSPHSLFETFTLLAAGAAGKTQSLTLDLMGATPETYNQFTQIVQSGSASNGGTLSRYNALVASKEIRLNPDYKGFLHQLDGAIDIREGIDFTNKDQAKCETQSINDKVAKATHGLITRCLEPNELTPSTLVAMVNACYFKGSWSVKFKETKDLFYTFDQQRRVEIEVDMIQAKVKAKERSMLYSEHRRWEAVAIPYQEGAEMVIMLPPEGTEPTQISLDIFHALLEELSPEDFELTMPTYLFEIQYALEEHLETQDHDMFSHLADFSPMAEGGRLFVSKIKHSAKIETDKEGTRVAAATVVRKTKGKSFCDRRVKINRPFLFLIRDKKEQHTIRFMGQVWNPAAKE